MKTTTPVLLVIFNRPDLTLQQLERLREAKPVKLYVAADGPRSGKQGEAALCAKTRELINTIDWDCEVKTLFREENIGCGRAVSSAITWMLEQEEYGIILEDDCLPDTSFFPFCEELLLKYQNNNNVFFISGSNKQNGALTGNGSYYFSYYASTWGWATWRRAWKYFTYTLNDLEESFKQGKLDHVFQSYTEKHYWFNKFKLTTKQNTHIWDYQWVYSVWKEKGMGIVPNVNLIVNTGISTAGTHTFLNDSIAIPAKTFPMAFPLIHPEVKIETKADLYTFNNVFSHSILRIIRLFLENGVKKSANYFIKKRIFNYS